MKGMPVDLDLPTKAIMPTLADAYAAVRELAGQVGFDLADG